VEIPIFQFYFPITTMKRTAIFISFFLSLLLGQQENRLFWDGGDWRRVDQLGNHNPEMVYRIKAAYINGVLDGRLYYYLKAWESQSEFADSLYSETIDYLTTREMVRSLDNFYKDPLHVYVPVPSAMLVATMYAERAPMQIIDAYIKQTKFWINKLILDLSEKDLNELLDSKVQKHLNKVKE